ncbi:MAG: RimK family alpha-L-glutamate ligase [Planctomycetes bacterium]|nr:RimK family alpha-L-glutamate ligase [Planctomycetota bacterium]
MKILILSRGKDYYSTQRLVAEALKLRHKAVVVNPLECDISLGMTHDARRTTHDAQHKTLNLSSFDIVIPRIGIIGIDYALLVAHQLEFMGKPMLNSARSLDYAKNKFLSLQILAKSGIPVPATLMLRTLRSAQVPHNPTTVKNAIKQLGGLPVVLKLFRGSQGKGVMLGENIASVDSILTAVWAIGFDIILQKYLKETKGEDIRVLVLNNEVIAAMKRTPAKGDFRSNIHQGGSVKKVAITAQEKQLAINATRALGLKLSGIDIMRTKNGPLVLEVNASPGFEGLEKVTGLNIARRIVDFTTTLNV